MVGGSKAAHFKMDNASLLKGVESDYVNDFMNSPLHKKLELKDAKNIFTSRVGNPDVYKYMFKGDDSVLTIQVDKTSGPNLFNIKCTEE